MFGLFKKLFGGNGEEIKEALAAGAVVIDVRSPGEFAGGHAKNAVNIPLDQIGKNIKKIQNYKKPVVVCCASGMRSARAKGLLSAQGITVFDAGSWVNLR